MPSNRRKVLKAIGASSLASVIASGSSSALSLNSKRQQPNTEFNPSNAKEVREFSKRFRKLSQDQQSEAVSELGENQREALGDVFRPAGVKKQRFKSNGDGVKALSQATRVFNKEIEKKWGWEINSNPTSNVGTEVTNIRLGPATTQSNTKEADSVSTASCSIEESGHATYGDEITAYSTFGNLLVRWRHEIEWDYSYCAGGTGPAYNKSASNIDALSYSKYTDPVWSYDGNVSSDTDEYDTKVTSFRQDKYSGPSSDNIPSGELNPYSELEGDWGGTGEVLNSGK